VHVEMPCMIMIEQVWRCTCRPWLYELGVHNRASLEMHLEAVIERIWRYIWTPRLSERRDTLRDHD